MGVNCHACKRISVLQLLDELFRGNKRPVCSQKGFTVQHQIYRERQESLSQPHFQKKEASCKVESSLGGRGHGHILTRMGFAEMLCVLLFLTSRWTLRHKSKLPCPHWPGSHLQHSGLLLLHLCDHLQAAQSPAGRHGHSSLLTRNARVWT